MDYNNAINYLYSLQKHGIKLGLDNSVELLSHLGNPQDYFQSIHIAGTNGKGSTAAMIASILQTAGLKVGLFTSPHLVNFTERIKVNNEEITESEVVGLTEEIRLKVESLKINVQPFNHSTIQPSILNTFEPTFFEFVTAMGFLYFKRKNVEWAVIETGMGGRLDATNVLIPEVSVITSISYDHKEFLGDTISAIAGEKAGIIKDEVPVVCAMQEKEAEEVIRIKADEKLAPLFIYEKDFKGILRSSEINGITFDYADDNYTIKDLFVPLTGKHQFLNACLAIKAAMIALQRAEEQKSRRAERETISDATALREGLATTRWPGRLEFVSENPPILIDGAHNPSASVALSDSLRKFFSKRYPRLILIVGIMADKDINGIMKPLLPVVSEIILTAPSYERAASPQRLAECALSLGFNKKNIYIAPSVKEAIEMAKKCGESLSGESVNRKKSFTHSPIHPFTGSLILITGSFYTIGEAKEMLCGKGILSRLRE